MPALIRNMLSNFAIGFLIGSAAAITLVLLRQPVPLAPGVVALWLQIFALGAPVGMGFLGTALSFDADE